ELARDHPGSDLVERARVWIERSGGGALPALAPDRVPGPAAATAGPGSAEARAAEGQRPYTVQLGAFSTPDRARLLAAMAREAGLEPRLVRTPGSVLFQVRIGRFGGAGDASALLARAAALGFD